MSVALYVEGVSKRFRLASQQPSSLKERVVHLNKKTASVPFWALRDVTFKVDQGETIGLLGHNGSGKSTLLKLVGGIMKPTSGEIRVRGRVASLLELGAGFHPELTGRENVYLNGAILGLARKEIDARFDEIVDFAEIEQFIDAQVRNYSSGMFLRLGFAVATNVDPDILLVDEVLAVGDENFQRKCIERIHRFKREGRTIVVVSHSADQLRRLCDRIAVLDRGELVAYGHPSEAIRTFRDHMLQQQLDRQAAHEQAQLEAETTVAQDPGEEGVPAVATQTVEAHPSLAHGASQEAKRNLRVRFSSIELEHAHSTERKHLLAGESLTLRVGFEARERTEDVVFGIAIYDARDGANLYATNTDLLELEVPPLEGVGEILFEIESLPLLDGTYPLTFGIHSKDEGVVYDWSEQRHWFTMMSSGQALGLLALPLTAKISLGQQ